MSGCASVACPSALPNTLLCCHRLTIPPRFHAVVDNAPHTSNQVYNGTVRVEPGMFEIHVGGGQPGTFTELYSTSGATLSTQVNVLSGANVRTECKRP